MYYSVWSVWLIWIARIYAGFYEFPRLILMKLPYLLVTIFVFKVEQRISVIQNHVGGDTDISRSSIFTICPIDMLALYIEGMGN
jgi:hypothetical protein